MRRIIAQVRVKTAAFATRSSSTAHPSSPLSSVRSADSGPRHADGEWEKLGRLVFSTAKFVGIAWFFDTYIFHLSMTQGPSMMPTLNEMGDLVIVDRLSPRWEPITRGDVVIAGSPTRESDYRVCKRVIALGGDRVHLPSGRIVHVPDGFCWLEGDNPHNSTDSRHYGPVPQQLIDGRVCMRVWPLTRVRRIHREQGRPESNTLLFEQMLQEPLILGHARWWSRTHGASTPALGEVETAPAALSLVGSLGFTAVEQGPSESDVYTDGASDAAPHAHSATSGSSGDVACEASPRSTVNHHSAVLEAVRSACTRHSPLVVCSPECRQQMR